MSETSINVRKVRTFFSSLLILPVISRGSVEQYIQELSEVGLRLCRKEDADRFLQGRGASASASVSHP